MAINYPTSLDNFTNPTSSSPINSPSHADQHANANDAIEALEAKVGVTGSAVTTSHDYKIAQLESLVTSSVAGAKSIYQDVRNQSGTALSKATPVYVSGSEGASGKMLISAASNAAESTSSKTMGITTSAIADNSNGQVISEGILEGIDTTGAADGDPVWLGVNGAKIYGLVNKPSAPSHLVFLGVVIRGGQANTGSMYVKIQNGFEIEELHNVEVASKVNGNILAYDSTSQTWKNTNTLQSTSSTIPLVIKGSESQSVNIFEVQRSPGSVNFAVADLEIFGYRRMTLTTAGASAGALIIKGSASQTADLQNWTNSSGTALGAVTSSGRIWATSMTVAASGGVTSGSQFGVVISSASSIGAVIKGATSQTADLFQIQNSSSAFLFTVGATGNTWIRGGARVSGNYGGTQALLVQNDQDIIGVTIKANATQTANLQEWQNSSGAVLGSFNPYGSLYISNQIQGGTAQFGNMGYANASQVVLKVQGSASQTANLQEWQISDGTVRARINADGHIIGSTRSAFGTSAIISGVVVAAVADAATAIPLIAKGTSGQTANLQEWQDSSGGVRTAINAGGALSVNYANQAVTGSSGSGAFEVKRTAFFDTGFTTNVGIIVRGRASQTANLQEWQNSSGTVLARIANTGQLLAPSIVGSNFQITSTGVMYVGGESYTAQANIQSLAASTVGLIVKAAASQTANLQEWQDSSGNVVASINYLGLFNNSTTGIITKYVRLGGSSYLGTLSLTTETASTIGAVIRGSASQTADLQQWQASDGSVLANVDKNGYFRGPLVEVRPTNAGLYGVAIAANASQSGDLFQITDVSNNAYTGVSATGKLVTGNTTNASRFTQITDSALGQLTVYSPTASTKGIVVKAAASQTANLQEWQDSYGGVKASFDNNGRYNLNATYGSGFYGRFNVAGTSSDAYSLDVSTINGNTPGVAQRINLNNNSDIGLIISGYASYQHTGDLLRIDGTKGNGGGDFFRVNANGAVQAYSATQKALTIKGYASQTANLTEWQNSAGTVNAYVTVNGDIYSRIIYAGNAADYNAIININTLVSTRVGLIVKGVASQTANLQEWQDSTGAVSSRMTDYGKLFSNYLQSNYGILTGGATYGGGYNFISNPTFATTDTTLIVKAVASQTADLQQWQNSAGIVLVKITSDGTLNSGNITSTNNAFLVGHTWAYDIHSSADYGATMMQFNSGKNLAITASTTIVSQSAGTPALSITGPSSPTTNIQEWKNSSGTIMARINSNYIFESYNGVYSYQLGSSSDGTLVAQMGTNGSIAFAGTVSIPTIKSSASSIISANTATTVDTVALSSFTTIEYTISIKQGSKIRSSKVLVHTDGTSVDSTEYGIMEMGGGITGILVSASVSSTNSILQITITDAATTNATVKLIKTML